MKRLNQSAGWLPQNISSLLVVTSLILLTACSQDQESTESTSASIENSSPADALVANNSTEDTNLGYRRINSSNDNDPLDAHIYELDNGLQVYLTENHEEPRFYAEIAVRAGSKHDPSDGTGLAHYLEHLLFKGNQNLGTLNYEAEKPHLDRIVELYEEHHGETDETRRAEIYAEINSEAQLAAEYSIPNEIDKLYNAMGSSGLNAHTSYEETVYKVGLPSNRLTHWAKVEADRFVNPVFRLFHTELETVYEEKNRSLDNAQRIVLYAGDNLLYKQHPYGQQPTIGTTEHLKNPSLVYIQNYFDTYYVPNNMAIFISGDIEIEETIELIATEFSHWEAKPIPEVGPWVEEPLQGAERVTVQYPGEEYVQLAFRTAANGDADVEALILVDMILDNRTAGLINLNLSQRQEVSSAGSYPNFLNDYGSQQLWGVPKQDQTLEEVEQLLLEQLEIIKNGEFEAWIIPAIVNDFKKNQKASLESNTARVSNMRSAFLTYAEWDHYVGDLERMEQLSKQDVVDAANKYFGDDYVAVYRVDAQNEIPSVEKPQIDPVNIDPTRQSQFAASLLELPFEEIEPSFVEPDQDYRVIEYANGVELYYSPNPLNDLFSFSIDIETGTEENELLSLSAALLDVAGAGDLSNEQLQKELYRMGSEYRFGSGENSSAMSMVGLDDEFENSLQLMLDAVKSPTSDEQTLEVLKGIILKSRQDQKSAPPAIARALYLFNRYGEESPMLESLPSSEIQAAELDELLALPAQLLDYKHTITYTGSLPLEDLVAILRRHHVVGEELKATPPIRMRTARAIDETEILVVDKETAQAQVRIEFPDTNYDESLSVPASIYNNYFGTSMSSVVFQEMREARALAYSASARYAQGSREGAENIMLGAIGTQTDKTVDALAAFIDLIDNMPESADRFSEAVNAQINRYRTSRVSFREVIGAVRGWERLGLEGDPRKNRYEELQAIAMEDLLNFQREHVKDRPKLISIVGDLSIIDTEELEQFGTVKEVQVDELFVE